MYSLLTIGLLGAGHRGVLQRPGVASDTCPCLGRRVEGRERREKERGEGGLKERGEGGEM
jgi:hypothetical protein